MGASVYEEWRELEDRELINQINNYYFERNLMDHDNDDDPIDYRYMESAINNLYSERPYLRDIIESNRGLSTNIELSQNYIDNLVNFYKIDFPFDDMSKTFDFELNEYNKLQCRKFLNQILSSSALTDKFFSGLSFKTHESSSHSNNKTVGEAISIFMLYLDLEYGYISDNEDIDINSLTTVERYNIFYNDLIWNPVKGNLRDKDVSYYIKRYSGAINKFILDKEKTKFNFNTVLSELKSSTKFLHIQKMEFKHDQKIFIEGLNKFGSFKNVKLKSNVLTRSKSI